MNLVRMDGGMHLFEERAPKKKVDAVALKKVDADNRSKTYRVKSL